ncbi:OpgC domain-containing protein [Noviherbaspirillum sp. CPCC 100848]|uniref:OpgC domain-containing protein n=1 Tax=Noviherbaspirillum album TaxID=3080276 RepID=A0ABU6J2Z7_9BURK|nr:OpgC domain-containing protein [Noviherbaspirillum sp. CPCC 100848]MEC4717801.1 OpgC domain-containing protein [Noviherbaspirillum sp. CPCC 100848]
MNRLWDLDMLRGLMLILMFVTHLPTRFSSMLSQPFGFVSAAEGFVMLSAFMAGMVYAGKGLRDGIPAMRNAFIARALKIYACHAALLLFLFSVMATVGLLRDQRALTDLLGFYLNNPLAGLWGGLLLIYNPPLLDILPLYIMFMLLSPLILEIGLRRGWQGIFAVSIALWVMAQTRISETLYDVFVILTDFQVPYRETGSFETYAWQFLWVLGLWMGAKMAKGELKDRKPFPKALIAVCLLYAAVMLIWRYVAGQVPIQGDSMINHLFDKWHLGPFRLLNFFAMVILIMHFGDAIKARLPRIGALETMGAASLPVFCAHLVVVLLVLSIYGGSTPERGIMVDVMLMAGGLAILYVVAVITLMIDKESNPKRRSGTPGSEGTGAAASGAGASGVKVTKPLAQVGGQVRGDH